MQGFIFGSISDSLFAGVYAWFDLQFLSQAFILGLILGLVSSSLFAGVYAWFDLQFPVCRDIDLVRSPIPCLQGYRLGSISNSLLAGV